MFMARRTSSPFWTAALSSVCISLSLCAAEAKASHPSGLVEPVLHVDQAHVALTLDACMGGFDRRIADMLIAKRIPATIFATSRWIRHNPEGLALLLAHKDLFEIEDHGAEHIPAVLGYVTVFGLQSAGTKDAVLAEVDGGAQSIREATGLTPLWYRDATALYTPSLLSDITSHGFKVAGFSLNADFGASLPAQSVAQRIKAAKGGDVIIAHINQPTRSSGAGVVQGVLDLAARGVRFIRLDAGTAK